MNGVWRTSLSYSISISQYNVLCIHLMTMAVFILSTTLLYHENRFVLHHILSSQFLGGEDESAHNISARRFSLHLFY